MNWFHYIIITLLAFVGMLVYFAVRSVNTPLDLVTEKYYEAELNFQDKIDEKANAAKLDSSVNISVKEKIVSIAFPQEQKGISGTLTFYYAGDKSKDKTIELHVNESNKEEIEINNLTGLYTVQLNWVSEGKKYYVEKKLFL